MTTSLYLHSPHCLPLPFRHPHLFTPHQELQASLQWPGRSLPADQRVIVLTSRLGRPGGYRVTLMYAVCTSRSAKLPFSLRKMHEDSGCEPTVSLMLLSFLSLGCCQGSGSQILLSGSLTFQPVCTPRTGSQALFFFLIFRAALVAYGSSQARG